jgi:hypothetical protein
LVSDIPVQTIINWLSKSGACVFDSEFSNLRYSPSSFRTTENVLEGGLHCGSRGLRAEVPSVARWGALCDPGQVTERTK